MKCIFIVFQLLCNNAETRFLQFSVFNKKKCTFCSIGII